ncbi:MAG: META domain-containing protein [Rhodospirillaceae bacterium]|nr:META domain-containing protein [Rhodospirillaceae bacterium]
MSPLCSPLRAAAMAALLLLATAWSGAALAADLPQRLVGTAWTLIEWNGKPPEPAGKATVVFGAAGALSGQGFCNSYLGTYSLTGDRVALEVIGWTKMWCGGGNMLDTKFGADLKRAVRLDPAGQTLVAYDAAGAVVFRFQRTGGAEK